MEKSDKKPVRNNRSREPADKFDTEILIAVCIAVFTIFLVLGVLAIVARIIIIGLSGDSDSVFDDIPVIVIDPSQSELSNPSDVGDLPGDAFGPDNATEPTYPPFVIVGPDRQKPTQPAPDPTPPIHGVRSSTGDFERVNIDGAPFLGREDAPVTVVEFSDFECPFCRRWYEDSKGRLEREYIDTGKVKLVYMHFPLSFHPEAMPAALASECAYEQGKFWEFHDLIFENQQVIGEANYKKWAGELGLDQGQFDDCYDSRKYEADVQDDFSKGQGAGIRGTPGFLVNGRLVSGAQPFQVFQAAIEAELNS